MPKYRYCPKCEWLNYAEVECRNCGTFVPLRRVPEGKKQLGEAERQEVARRLAEVCDGCGNPKIRSFKIIADEFEVSTSTITRIAQAFGVDKLHADRRSTRQVELTDA